MKIWLCIPVFNRLQLTLKCLSSLEEQTFKDFEIVICDDNSSDGTYEYLSKHYPDVHLLKGTGDLWWTGGTNRCVQYVQKLRADDNYALTLNNDLVLASDYIEKMVYWASKHKDAIFTSITYDINDRDNPVYVGSRRNWFIAKDRKLSPNDNGQYTGIAEITHASGRGTLIPISIFKAIGLFNETSLPHYAADYDFTFRAREARYKIYINYDAIIYSHVEETGITCARNKGSLKEFVFYLTNRKSPGALIYRTRFALMNCPRKYLPFYLFFDNFFTIFGYFKHVFLKKLKGTK